VLFPKEDLGVDFEIAHYQAAANLADMYVMAWLSGSLLQVY
jgi:hypothetical protein